MTTVVVSDFDGTLTSRDTLVEFIRFAKGNVRCLLGFMLYSPLMVLMMLKLYPNGKCKQRLFAHFFRGMSIEEFRRLGTAFAANRQDLLRPGALDMLQQCESEGTRVIIVSASITDWVQPFFPHLAVLGTQVEVQDGVLTGRFLSRNCHGEEKVRRLSELLPDRDNYHLIAYGDSSGDKAMLDYANEAHYKPFR